MLFVCLIPDKEGARFLVGTAVSSPSNLRQQVFGEKNTNNHTRWVSPVIWSIQDVYGQASINTRQGAISYWPRIGLGPGTL